MNRFAYKAMGWLGSIHSLAVHTLLFVCSFSLVFFGVEIDKILLVVTTIVSLEAIYMAIFIQMAVNRNSQSLEAVEEDIDEIQEDIDEIQEDVDEIQKDVDEIEKDVDEIEKEDTEEEKRDKQNKFVLDKIETRLVDLISQIEKMKSELR